jgi:hypothetical protein
MVGVACADPSTKTITDEAGGVLLATRHSGTDGVASEHSSGDAADHLPSAQSSDVGARAGGGLETVRATADTAVSTGAGASDQMVAAGWEAGLMPAANLPANPTALEPSARNVRHWTGRADDYKLTRSGSHARADR